MSRKSNGHLSLFDFEEKQMENKTHGERYFSVELKSKANLKNVSLTNGKHESVLVEGTIGEFIRAEFVEGTVLEVVGAKGVLRVDLVENEIKKPKLEKEA
jgi:hypothetical protein